MDDSNLINDFRLVFHAGSNYSETRIQKILRGLFSIRDMDNLIHTAHRHLFQAIKSGENFNDRCVLPCDVVQLRDILSSGKIQSRKNIVMFSTQVMKQVVDGYNVLLLIKGNPDDFECEQAGGMLVLDSTSLDISDKIVGIILQKGAPYKTVKQIVSDTGVDCPVYGEALIPGIDMKKVTAAHKQRFKIDLPSLHIFETIVADNDYDAVKKALAIRWDRHPDSKELRKPARYSVDYWLYSGFWDSIVKSADSHTQIKTAQEDPQNMQLSQQEQEIFNTIMAIDQEFGLGQQYRVAGGWVRDKLLGKESDDIDIALDGMTGRDFAEKAKEYSQRHPDSKIGKMYTVEQNADKSKHLETTAIEISGLKIDLVNLRTEDYADDSRIPEMRFGTPEEDASRRDLTINAMFYNVNTGQVEDNVGGLEDLQSMTLRTPLDPKQTFMDDPLRMLRALRFHSRYNGSTLSPEIIEAMSDPEVHEAYRTKVSPERAGPEIMKTFQGETPEESIRILHETGMDAALLNLPDFQELNPMNMDQRNKHHELDLLNHTLKTMKNYNDMLAQNGVDGDDRALALIASWFHDMGKRHPEIARPKEDDPDQYSYHGHEDVSFDLVNSFLKSIGIGSEDRKFVSTIVQQHMAPHAHNSGWSKRQMGKLRNNTTIPGQERDDIWKFVMWHAHADAAAKSEESDIGQFPDYDQRYSDTEAYMNAPPPAKAIINGKQLMDMFPDISPRTGFIKDIQAYLIDEQNAGVVTDFPSALEAVRKMGIEEKYKGQAAPVSKKKMRNNQQQQKLQQPPQIISDPNQVPNAERELEASMSNWYRKKIEADASSGASSGSDDFNAGPEGSGAAERQRGEKHMIRYEPGSNSIYQKGDRVKRRQVGLVNAPTLGKVISKKDGILKIKWDDGDEQKFDLGDVELPMLVERV